MFLIKDCCQNSDKVPKETHCNHRLNGTKSSFKLCNTPLFRHVSLRNGVTLYYPFKVYCYNYITSRLECLLQHKGYEDMCSKWKYRERTPDIMSDVYDGEVWKYFQNYKGTAFLNASNTCGLQLNVTMSWCVVQLFALQLTYQLL